MKRILSLLLSLLLVIGCGAPAVSADQSGGLTVSFKTAVYSISKETFLRWTDERASTADCGKDEYVTVCAVISNPSDAAVTLKKPCISIDGGEKLYWGDFTLEAGKTAPCHVFYANRKYLTSGLHTAAVYASDKPLGSGHFGIGRDWSKVFKFPTEKQIAARPADQRSPYVCTWLTTGKDVLYDAYCVDFKSDYIPNGTYSSLFNGYLDFSSLEEKYASVDTGGVSLYGGLQMGDEGATGNSILSFWDICCTGKDGKTTTIRPVRTYPAEKTDDDAFTGEGDGAHTLLPYEWKAGRWYRMLLQCGTSKTTGNATVDQWFQDLATGKWTHMCTYDLGFKSKGFTGNAGIFSENFKKQYAAQVRSLEFTNVRIHTSSGWQAVESTTNGGIGIQPYGVHEKAYGSWEAGKDGNTFYMITAGVSGWGRKKSTEALKIQNRETGSPLSGNPLK